jgi:pimeloyl-ACP methyl ester carboxylesterase
VAAPVQVAHTTDGDVGYRSVGSGPPLLLIMGFSGTMDNWDPRFVDDLAVHHRVITFDNAGIGRTSPLSPLSISAMAGQTSALITALGLDRTDVLGWSMGGMIAQALAVDHPGQVDHLALCATLPGDGHYVSPSASALATLDDPGNVAGVLAQLFPANQKAAERAYVAGITSYPAYYTTSTATLHAQEAVLPVWVGGHDPAGVRTGSISAPTLVADGAEDPLGPTADDRELATVIPHATLVIYPDAAHAFMFQDASTFVPRLEQFLGS